MIGFYRTTAICGVSMPEEDRALAANAFCQPTSVFLVIETGHSSIGEARFCFWGEGELFDWPVMLFPFDAEELAIRRAAAAVEQGFAGSHTGLAPVPSLRTKAGDLSGSWRPRTLPRSARTAGAAGTVGRNHRAKAGRRWLVATLVL